MLSNAIVTAHMQHKRISEWAQISWRYLMAVRCWPQYTAVIQRSRWQHKIRGVDHHIQTIQLQHYEEISICFPHFQPVAHAAQV